MTINNEERVRILVQYWGQDADISFTNDMSGEHQVCKINADSIAQLIAEPEETVLCVYLKELSCMTEEEYLHIGHIAGYEVDRHNSTELLLIMKGKKLIDGIDRYTVDDSMVAFTKIIDYVRMRGYATNYNGQSLFDLGIALKKQVTVDAI